MEWESTDALLLLCIRSKRGFKGATLTDIMALADAIDRSSFTFEEIKSGLEKLVAIDYVKIVEGRLYTTATFKGEFKGLGKGNIWDNYKAIVQLLKTKQISPGKFVEFGPDMITKEDVESSYKEYYYRLLK